MTVRTLPAQLLTALRTFVVLSVLLGLAYPLALVVVGAVALPRQAHGSLVRVDGQVVGSSLVGQSFLAADGTPLPQWFQSRPSAAGDGYDPTRTAASNRGPGDATDTLDRTSLRTQVCDRSAAVGSADGVSGARPSCPDGSASPAAVPPDAVTASGSGLDPHISPAYARLQVDRVAAARGLDPARVRALVEDHVQGRVLGFLGEPRVDVLELDLALARLR